MKLYKFMLFYMVTIRVLGRCDRVNSYLLILPNSVLCPAFRLLVRDQQMRMGCGAYSHVFGFQELGMWLGGWVRALQRTKNLPSQRSPKNNYQLTQVAFEGDSSIGMSGLSLVQPGAPRCVEELNKGVYFVRDINVEQTSSSIVAIMIILTGPKNVRTPSSDSFIGYFLCEIRIESV